MYYLSNSCSLSERIRRRLFKNIPREGILMHQDPCCVKCSRRLNPPVKVELREAAVPRVGSRCQQQQIKKKQLTAGTSRVHTWKSRRSSSSWFFVARPKPIIVFSVLALGAEREGGMQWLTCVAKVVAF